MTTADAVREVGLALPRTYERLVGGRWKLKIGQIVYVSFAKDEATMGFGYPREARTSLVEGEPETFFLPATSDLRYQWVCARLDRLDGDEMRELVVDAWRMCTPRMLHELPDLAPPTASAWAAIDRRDWPAARPLLHPHLQWHDGAITLHGRDVVLAHLAEVATPPRPPDTVQVRDGQVYRWSRG
ncbi:MAG: MmcQ/YjbR family DNA-binding protein [Nocardioidaceae bacterium]